MVLPAGQRPRNHERDHAEDEPRTQLVQMLDDRQPVVVADRPDAGRCPPYCRSPAVVLAVGLGFSAASSEASSCSRSLSLPVTEFLNSRMPRPSDFPRSGSRLGPKITSTMTRTMTISSGPGAGGDLLPAPSARLSQAPPFLAVGPGGFGRLAAEYLERSPATHARGLRPCAPGGLLGGRRGRARRSCRGPRLRAFFK